MKSQRNTNKFNFFVPCNIIKKAESESDKGVVIVEGIASSSSTADSDGETLFPMGMNVLPLLESGLVNFNHQGGKDANANVGICTEAKVINNGQDLYVKCMLWPCPQTDGIVRMYENFKKYSPNRKVGFSIEGISTKKDPHDGKRILRADITGLAICSNPKNKNTLMNIVKGHYDVPFIELETVDSVIQGKQSKNYGEGIDVFNVNNHTDLKKLVQRLDNENDMIIKKSGQSDPILEKAICAIESLYTVPIESYYRLRSMNIILQRD